MPRLSEWSSRAAEILSAVTDRWVLAGALAALQYRRVERGSVDVDFLVEWSEDLAPAFEAAGYTLEPKTDPLVDHPHLLVCRRGEERIDLIVATVPYQSVAIDRGRDHVLSVEDVIIHKLIAWRYVDREDIASILAARHSLDLAYIDKWVREWDIEDRWQQASSGRL